MKSLHIDIETYSETDLKSSGVYRYVEDPAFEILMIAYCIDDEPIKIMDLKCDDWLDPEFLQYAKDPRILKKAHNATFERICLSKIGIDIPASQWRCTMVKSAFCGLPLSLQDVSKALNLSEEKSKLTEGKALIRYFTVPCRPTKTNNQRTRNLPHHDLIKWENFKNYCMRDVEAERTIDSILKPYHLPAFEIELYALDQKINDRGVLIDRNLAVNATLIDQQNGEKALVKTKDITGVDNPNSLSQLKHWIFEEAGIEIQSLAKDQIDPLIDTIENEAVRAVLRLRKETSKTSIRKYDAMLKCMCSDGRGRGFFQYYGANRTGRWAGRYVQLHNLKKNFLEALGGARYIVSKCDTEMLEMIFDDVSDVLSQLIRTAFIAPLGSMLSVADFSAIEARVIAWLASEEWRLDVFSTHGRIYEASAASMFNVDIKEITKGSTLRQKGKIAELALGYQGGIGALKQMGADRMGLSDSELQDIVKRWRRSSPAIVKLWQSLETGAKRAIRQRGTRFSICAGKITFQADRRFLTIQLPSKRKLYYQEPRIVKKTVTRRGKDPFTADSITYMGLDQDTKKWGRIDTYGGKLAENVTQAIARDLLAVSLLRLDREGFDLTMHVHDECVAEVVDNPHEELKKMCDIMKKPPVWAKDLPLDAEGYVTPFYRKD